jgi:hypothetical protein
MGSVLGVRLAARPCGNWLEGEEPSDATGALGRRKKAKRRLAVSQEPLGPRTSLHAERRQ